MYFSQIISLICILMYIKKSVKIILSNLITRIDYKYMSLEDYMNKKFINLLFILIIIFLFIQIIIISD